MAEPVWRRLTTGDATPARLLRFALVGATTGVLFALLVALLVGPGGVAEGRAAGIAYLALLPVNFLGHKRAVYRSRRPALPEALRFLVMHGITLTACVVTMEVATGPLALSHWAGSALIVLLAPAMNLLLMELWVFATVASREK